MERTLTVLITGGEGTGKSSLLQHFLTGVDIFLKFLLMLKQFFGFL